MLRRLILAIAVVSVVPFTHASAAVAGHDERIAFARLCGTGCGDLYTVRPDGSDLRRLTRTRDNFAPAWSPDGRKIAFASDRATAGASQIYVMRSDGRRLRRVTSSGGTTADADPAWSSDGTRIAFARERLDGGRSGRDIWVTELGTRSVKRLTSTRDLDAAPAWSPDGERIAFTRERDGRTEVWVIDADGGRARPLSPLALRDPAWSPDGKTVAASGARGIYLVGADGTSAELIEHTEGATEPVFSGDGKRLAFTVADRIHTLVRATGQRRRITRPGPPLHDVAASWCSWRACGRGSTITRDAIAGVTIGASRARLERLWGSPDRVTAGAEGTEVATWQAAYDGSRPVSYASVVLNSDRVAAMSVELTGTRLHTLRGDRLGTRAATIRRHWPGARRYRSCCAADVFYLTVRAAREGHVLVFALRRGAGLRSVHLVADRMFEDCFVRECD